MTIVKKILPLAVIILLGYNGFAQAATRPSKAMSDTQRKQKGKPAKKRKFRNVKRHFFIAGQCRPRTTGPGIYW
jgi:hypothetical protein